MNSNVIVLNNLTKYYGKHKGIENLSFEVKQGEVFGFIGPNGAGKSTTIRTLLALTFPTSGSATIFGKDCITNASEIAKDIGYLPSEVFYYDGMKVKDLLSYSASFYKKDCKEKTKILCDKLSLDMERKIEDLSYGNKKKVGIVQGLLHSPKLIILDEPTGGLDPLMQQTFFDILKDENKQGATILFSSHILSEVQKMCDRVAIIKNGELLKVQKISDLQSNSYKKYHIVCQTPLTENLFSLQGIGNLNIKANTANFIYNGDINKILKILSTFNLLDLSIEEPTLEEIFLHYYE